MAKRKTLQSEFVKSSAELSQCPEANLPEYAFIGRSNVGKSSLINMITERKELAKISGRPGKTQLINHFLINKEWYLTDLPGYGYAKISKTMRVEWKIMIDEYLTKRENLIATFLLIDGRHFPMKIDLDFIEWMAENRLPFFLVFTKTDKKKSENTEDVVETYKKELGKTWEELPKMIITSAKTGRGREEIVDLVEETNKMIDFSHGK